MKKIVFLFTLLALTVLGVQAQPGFDDNVEDTPIEGGLVILTVSALSYGFYKQQKEGFIK